MPMAWLFALTAIAGFVVLWLAVGYAVIKFTAWGDLEEHCSDRPEARINNSLYFQGAYIGKGALGPSYRGCLTFDVGPDGFRMRIWKIFAPFAKPVFIPWNSVETELVRVFVFTTCRIKTGPQNSLWITMPLQYARSLAAGSDGAFVVPDEKT